MILKINIVYSSYVFSEILPKHRCHMFRINISSKSWIADESSRFRWEGTKSYVWPNRFLNTFGGSKHWVE